LRYEVLRFAQLARGWAPAVSVRMTAGTEGSPEASRAVLPSCALWVKGETDPWQKQEKISNDLAAHK